MCAFHRLLEKAALSLISKARLAMRRAWNRLRRPAPVAEPVDARDSKSRSERSARSSRARGTINKFFKANPYDELVFPGRATTEGVPRAVVVRRDLTR